MNAPLVRLALPEDDLAVGELLVNAFTSAYARKLPWITYDEERKRSLRAVAEKREVATVWVAELDGEVVGTVALYPPGASDSQAWLPNSADLRHLATAPSVHGRGFSRALLDAAEAEAVKWNLDAICLHVRRGVDGVMRLYEARGFVHDPAGDLELPTVSLVGFAKQMKL